MTAPTPEEVALFNELHNAKAQRMKAQNTGDGAAFSAACTRIGELTAQIRKLLKEQEQERKSGEVQE